MKIKKVLLIILSAVLLLSLFGCGAKEKPLHEFYGNEKISTLATDRPNTVDISKFENGRTSALYDIGDDELIGRLADAFMGITVKDTAKTEDFTGKYYIDLYWNDDQVHIHMSDDIAEVITDGDIEFYKLNGVEDFLSAINAELEQSSLVTSEYIDIVNEQSVNVDVMKDITVDANGNCVVDINVLNLTERMIDITFADVKANGKRIDAPDILSVHGNSELGFRVTFKTGNIADVRRISLSVNVSFEGEDEPFIVSPIKTVKF